MQERQNSHGSRRVALAATGSVMALAATAAGTSGASAEAARPAIPMEGRGAAPVTVPQGQPDLTTIEGIKAYLDSVGLSHGRVEAFVAKHGLSSDQYYQMVLDASGGASPKEFPVEYVNGRIRYNNTVDKSMKVSSSRSSKQRGSVVDGRCTFPPIEVESDASVTGVAEVVEVDQTDCTRTVVNSTYDPAAVAPAATTSGGPWLDCTNRTGPPTTYQPSYDWVDGEHRAYYKQSFVDPICITITSSTLNVRWKNAANSSTDVSVMPGTTGRLFYYTDLGENWPTSSKLVWLVPQQTDWNSSKTSVWSDTSITHNYEATTFLGHQRTETDFPEHLLEAAALFGIGGVTTTIIACGADFSDTGFNSQQWLKARRNGYYFMSGSGDVWGGCSSLVHERTWYGGGTYAR